MNKQHRIAFLSQAWPEDPKATIAGSSVQVYYIARELASRGFPCLVILSSHERYRFSGENLEVVSVDGYKGLRKLLGRGCQKKLQNLLKNFVPDFIYQRGKLPETVAAERYCRHEKSKFIWGSNSDKSGERWKFVKKRWHKRKQHPFTLILRLIEAFGADILIERAVRRANIALAQTQVQKDALLSNFFLDAHLLGSGHFIPKTILSKISSDKPLVLWLANISPMKQPHLFTHLANDLQHTNAKFIMAGKAPDKILLSKVLKPTNKLKDFKYISEIGLLSGNQLFEKANIFISTSLSLYEGLPNTFIQALLHSTPIISLNADPDGIIQKYGLGEVVSTYEELKECVNSWLSDPAKRTIASEKALNFARSNFDIKILVNKLLEILA